MYTYKKKLFHSKYFESFNSPLKHDRSHEGNSGSQYMYIRHLKNEERGKAPSPIIKKGR